MFLRAKGPEKPDNSMRFEPVLQLIHKNHGRARRSPSLKSGDQ